MPKFSLKLILVCKMAITMLLCRLVDVR